MRSPLRFVIAISLLGLLSAVGYLAMRPVTAPSPPDRAGATPPAQRTTQTFYREELLRLQGAGIGRDGRLSALLVPLFATAEMRSRNADPVAENLALLDVLAGWAGGRPAPDPANGRLADFRLTLAGRRDLARHFLVSAGLAARGETALSHLVGLIKEIADADGGTGFSFADIAADRAGAHFGATATGSPDGARGLQRRLAVGIDDAQLLPPVNDLPERLDRDMLRERFGAPGSESYQALVAEIDRRILALGLYGD